MTKPKKLQRLKTGFAPVDDALGGGLVRGGLYLLVGDPGVGKTTLAMQVAAVVARRRGQRAFFVSGEQSREDLGLMVDRIDAAEPNLLVFTDLLAHDIEKYPSALLIVDTLRSVTVLDDAKAGSIRQVRAVVRWLREFANRTSTAVMMISHTNRRGEIAGPRDVEHEADAVMFLGYDYAFEGMTEVMDLRVLRIVKNRYGRSPREAKLLWTEKGMVEMLKKRRK